jgi:ribosomal protein L29
MAENFRNIGGEERNKKMKELKLELVKAMASAQKAGSSKTKQTKKMIARMLTFNKSGTDELKNKRKANKKT